MKPVVKLATGAICILILQASNAFAQLPAGCTGLNPATSGAGVESNWDWDQDIMMDGHDAGDGIWVVDTGGGLTAGQGWDWDEDFSSPFPACDNGVISVATEFLKILPPHGNGVISAATEFLNYANPHDRLRP